MTGYSLDFQRAGSEPLAKGVLRSEVDDFCVDEDLGFEPSGEGEHVLLQIRKRNLNTDQVAKMLQRCAGVSRRAVSWSGMKDRRAVTTQWFGVHVPGKGMDTEADWGELGDESLELLDVQRHHRKLRVGTHRGNRFRIRLRELDQPELLEVPAQRIQQSGVPNYFGPQRFGRNAANLERAPEVLARPRPKRHDFQRGIMLSAIRSWVFNGYLGSRVQDASWDQCLPGDALQFDGSGSFFRVDEVTGDISGRLECMEVHVTGPMWGAGDLPVGQDALARELQLRETHREFCALMEDAGLRQERRALRLMPRDFSCRLEPSGEASLTFSLPRGAFATAVLREIVDYRECT